MLSVSDKSRAWDFFRKKSSSPCRSWKLADLPDGDLNVTLGPVKESIAGPWDFRFSFPFLGWDIVLFFFGSGSTSRILI